MNGKCNRPIGNTGRNCILLPNHAPACEGPAPDKVSLPLLSETGKREFAEIALKFGHALSSYDPRYFRSMHHVSEAVDFHINRLKLNLSLLDITLLKEIVYNYFN